MSETMHTFCVIDQKVIPEEREKRRAVTCSDECRTELIARRRKRKDDKFCRQCGRPSTPEERLLFARWRRATFPAAKKGRPRLTPAPDQAQPPIETPNE
jgi:predicted nucleic acid-binding Zn ribbon protein